MLQNVKNTFLIVLLIPLFSFAQKDKVKNLENFDKKIMHFGFSLNTNSARFTVVPNNDILRNDSLYVINTTNQPGFGLGIVSDLKIFENFNLRFIPCLTFMTREMSYTFRSPARDSIYTVPKSVESTFLEFPLSLKFKSDRVNNYRMYILGGFKYCLDMSSNKEITTTGDRIILRLDKSDFLYEVGFGLDFYLTYFKLSPEIKYAFGMKNLLIKDNTIYSQSISALRTRAVYFSLTFE